MGVGGLLTPHCLQSCVLTASFCGVQWSQRVVVAAPTAAPRGDTSALSQGQWLRDTVRGGRHQGMDSLPPHTLRKPRSEKGVSVVTDTFCPLCRVLPTPVP